MNTKVLLEISIFVQLTLAVVVLVAMARRRALTVFRSLWVLLAVHFAFSAVSLALLFFRRKLHIGLEQAYFAYYAETWITSSAELVLRVLIVYAVFAEAMRPFSGLHSAGKLIFRWVGVVSSLVALALVAGPQVLSNTEALSVALGRLEQGVSVLTLCLLVFVCFAVRPLGLTFRSHLFGVSLGLGVSSTVELVQAAWSVTSSGHSLYSGIYLFGSAGSCVALAVWGAYFALPEPQRQMILLPTTSPFFFWNRISEILGDAPGQVAVAGFTPNMLAPAEIEMLTAAIAAESANETDSQEVLRPETSFLPELPAVRQPFMAL